MARILIIDQRLGRIPVVSHCMMYWFMASSFIPVVAYYVCFLIFEKNSAENDLAPIQSP